VVNRRGPRGTRRTPQPERRRAREVPVDPRGPAGELGSAIIADLVRVLGRERSHSGWLFRESRLGLGLHGGFELAKVQLSRPRLYLGYG
jgi:hypothetical protein